MKKVIKFVAAAAFAALVSVPALGCAKTQSVYGEYSYSMSSGMTYGCKVLVRFKGDRISNVDLINVSGWTQTSPAWAYNGNDASSAAKPYFDNLETVLRSLSSYSLGEIKSWKVLTVSAEEASAYNPAGTPMKFSDAAAKGTQQFENIPTAIWKPLGCNIEGAGATQSTGRLILAIQDAISKKQ